MLLDATAQYDIAVALDFSGHQNILVTSTIMRCRRLLRGVHALADADLQLEAVVLVRTMTEYAIKLTWMLTGDTEYHLAQWAIADIDGRLKMHNDVLRVSGVEVLPAKDQADLAAQRAGFVATCGGRTEVQPDLGAQGPRG